MAAKVIAPGRFAGVRACRIGRHPWAWGLAAGLLAIAAGAWAQEGPGEALRISTANGLSFARQPDFSLNMRFRIQPRVGLATIGGDDLAVQAADLRVRRLRLKLDGHVRTERLRYYVQLGFSRDDLDADGGEAQVVRDAMVYWRFNERFHVGLGQGKLPGNRQRMTSSGSQQFPDRSLADQAFNLDCDMGGYAYWTIPAGQQLVHLKGAVTSGEGRNAPVGDAGLCYTGRVEWLPLGAFAAKGDFSEGDLEMEPRPRLSLAAGCSYNDRARRAGGQLGAWLPASADITTLFADAVLKWQGWALSAEAFQRGCSGPGAEAGAAGAAFVTTGQGLNAQLSKCFRSRFEVASRYALVQPQGLAAGLRPRTEEAMMGLSRYLDGHRIKAQWSIGYQWRNGMAALDHAGNRWATLFQVELGI